MFTLAHSLGLGGDCLQSRTRSREFEPLLDERRVDFFLLLVDLLEQAHLQNRVCAFSLQSPSGLASPRALEETISAVHQEEQNFSLNQLQSLGSQSDRTDM